MSLVIAAKLDRLRKGLRDAGLDDNMHHYESLGVQWVSRGVPTIQRDSRLLKNIRLDVVSINDLPVLSDVCMCEQHIHRNCLIRLIEPSETRRVLVIGSCCYKALTNIESRRQLCSVEGCNNRHLNRKYTVCNIHKVELIAREKEVLKQRELEEALERERMRLKEARERERMRLEEARERERLRLEEARERELQRAKLEREQLVLRMNNMIFNFGRRFRGFQFKDIPVWYVSWLIKEQIHNPSVEKLIEYRRLLSA